MKALKWLLVQKKCWLEALNGEKDLETGSDMQVFYLGTEKKTEACS